MQHFKWMLSAALCLAAGHSYADSANVSTLPPAYQGGSNNQSMTPSGGLRVQPQDGAGNDVSSSHPLPVNASVSVTVDSLSPYVRTPLGQQTLTLSGTAQALTVPNTATVIDFFAEGTGGTNGNCLRYRDDTTAPTATVGAPMWPGQDYTNYTGSLSAIKFINATSATCTLTVNFYK